MLFNLILLNINLEMLCDNPMDSALIIIRMLLEKARDYQMDRKL